MKITELKEDQKLVIEVADWVPNSLILSDEEHHRLVTQVIPSFRFGVKCRKAGIVLELYKTEEYNLDENNTVYKPKEEIKRSKEWIKDTQKEITELIDKIVEYTEILEVAKRVFDISNCDSKLDNIFQRISFGVKRFQELEDKISKLKKKRSKK